MFKKKQNDFMVGKPLKKKRKNKKDEFNPSGSSKYSKPFMEKPKEKTLGQQKRLKNKIITIDEAFTKEKINASQSKQLKEHAEPHTLKHIKKMIVLMKQGKSFNQSHKIAMETVGM